MDDLSTPMLDIARQMEAEWQAAADHWRDRTANYFERTYWLPLAETTLAYIHALLPWSTNWTPCIHWQLPIIDRRWPGLKTGRRLGWGVGWPIADLACRGEFGLWVVLCPPSLISIPSSDLFLKSLQVLTACAKMKLYSSEHCLQKKWASPTFLFGVEQGEKMWCGGNSKRHAE
ncbi:hypothetical protein [Candidatus Amarolinea dominans]|uniref:hypothetical protein n=1 Tax=Candidatus Amarolinea dominans TaxID=3140696 RepID=UPI001DDEEDA3|nr:hypothetical protein [Anaerolineae bacterium]